MDIQLSLSKPLDNSDSKVLMECVLDRFGLLPRKAGAKVRIEALILELYERKKRAYKEKNPNLAIMTVEEMAIFSQISRQTMYDYLDRFLQLSILKKTSVILDKKLTCGYELSSNNLETSFAKALETINEQLSTSMDLIKKLQNEIKKEKLRFLADKSEVLDGNSLDSDP
jgi:hypothetical protein